MEQGGTIEGYEAVPLAFQQDADPLGSGAAVLRRRSARPGRRAVMYVHCHGDAFAPEDLVGWYTDRGFHFYAADLRDLRVAERANGDTKRPAQAAQDLGDCFTCLDAAAARARRGRRGHHDRVGARHRRGDLPRCGATPGAAMRTGRRAGPDQPGLGHAAALAWPGRTAGPRRRAAPLMVSARRRIRRGLDIACPVLVMCPGSRVGRPRRAGGPAVAARPVGPAGDHPARRARDLAEAARRAARAGAGRYPGAQAPV